MPRIWPHFLFRHAARPAVDPGDPSEQNPIRQLLDAAGLPWISPRSFLADRYGIRPHPAYGWDVIEIPTPEPIVSGLLWPLSVQAFPQFQPALPATDFSGVVWRGDDARDNLHWAVEQLQPSLGSPRVDDNANTLGRRWAFGPTVLRLTVWVPEIQRGPSRNPAHQREPRLKAGCRLSVKTGFRLAASAEELSWLDSFEPIAPIQFGPQITSNSAYETPAVQTELEFVRRPVAGFDRIFGKVGRASGNGAQIFGHAQLYLVPAADVIGFKVERLLPAKGSGGSQLYVECRTNYRAFPKKRLLISAAGGPDDSNDLAALLAAATGKPFELGDYEYNA